MLYDPRLDQKSIGEYMRLDSLGQHTRQKDKGGLILGFDNTHEVFSSRNIRLLKIVRSSRKVMLDNKNIMLPKVIAFL